MNARTKARTNFAHTKSNKTNLDHLHPLSKMRCKITTFFYIVLSV